MKVVLPLPAMPTHTIDTGRTDAFGEAVDASEAAGADMVKVCAYLSSTKVG